MKLDKYQGLVIVKEIFFVSEFINSPFLVFSSNVYCPYNRLL